MLWLFLLFSAGSILFMIINQLKISSFDGALSEAKKTETQVESKASGIESILIQGQTGERIPKNAYWIMLGKYEDKFRLGVDAGIYKVNDYDRFVTDVESGRVAYIYRPGFSNTFFIPKLGSIIAGIYKVIELVPVDDTTKAADVFGSDARLLPVTVIGVPAEVVAKK